MVPPQMLLPFNTDAPIYYWPYTTVGLIIVNVAMFFGTAAIAMNDSTTVQLSTEEVRELIREIEDEQQRKLSAEERRELETMLQTMSSETSGSMFVLGYSPKVQWLTLEFDRIHPLQWLTNAFMHADVLHLIGNMIFLWGFGLVIEGKLGWWKFLLVYLIAGITQAALIQTLMYVGTDDRGVALGASGAIYSIIAIAVLWAPQSEMSCLLFIRLFPRVIEMPIVAFGGIYLAMQVGFWILRGFSMSSEALHLAGILVGVPLGLLFLKRKWVDCEGWDYHTVYFANEKQQERVRNEFRDRNRRADEEEKKQERQHAQEQIISSLTSALSQGQHAAAAAIYHKFNAELQTGQKVPDALLPKLIAALHAQKQWEPSVPLLVQLLKRLPAEKSATARLKLAQILITQTEQPRQGFMVLKKMSKPLTEKQITLRNKLAKAAKSSLAAGNSYEVEVHDW